MTTRILIHQPDLFSTKQSNHKHLDGAMGKARDRGERTFRISHKLPHLLHRILQPTIRSVHAPFQIIKHPTFKSNQMGHSFIVFPLVSNRKPRMSKRKRRCLKHVLVMFPNLGPHKPRLLRQGRKRASNHAQRLVLLPNHHLITTNARTTSTISTATELE